MKIRGRRMMLGLTQQGLAKEVGVTYQQIHKYEVGSNRVSAANLFTIANTLGVEISYFFEDWESGVQGNTTRERDVLEFVKLYLVIPKRLREALRGLMRIIADSPKEE